MTRKSKTQIQEALTRMQAEMPNNRAFRRAQKKQARAFTNDMKRHKPMFRNNLAVAADRAAALTEQQMTDWMTPIIQSFDMLRMGKARENEFNNLVKCMNIAMLLTRHDVARLLPDHRDKFSAAMDALAAIGVRALNNKTWTCYAAELQAIDTGLEYHTYQCQFASKAEMLRAEAILEAKEAGAAAGTICADGIDLEKLAEQKKTEKTA